MEVSPWVEKWGRRVCDHPNFWSRLAKLEDFILSDKLKEQKIEAPIFITGLARSGSTILLEILNQHPSTKSFCYHDFPFVQIPWFWSWFVKNAQKPTEAVERAHKDRILVTPDSPEAMEEMLWMQYFPQLHAIDRSQLFDETNSFPDFERAYQHMIKKLLIAYEGKRYLSKGNYNISRVRYLLKLFPDAKIIIPKREPISHIASLIKQHKLFVEAESKDPKILEHMRREGHFEFGLDRRAINFGDPKISQEINRLWDEGKNVEGYALQWREVYQYAESLRNDAAIRDSILIVDYETLCKDSENVLENLFRFVKIDDAEHIIERYSKQLSEPKYYTHGFTEEELNVIESTTKEDNVLKK